ncbi:hypothetical protein TeGR_g3592, partial [Tetraparma gracilis]
YPADATGWRITGVSEVNVHNADVIPFGRRMEAMPANREREIAAGFDADVRRLSSTSSLCDASQDSACKTCIETQDSWCAGSSWDKFCKDGCDGPTQYMAQGCKAECSEPAIISVKAKKVAEIEKETPVDCQVSDWSQSGSCNFRGGIGFGGDGVTTDPVCLADRMCGCKATHTRTVTQPALHGGAPCPAIEETVECDCPAVMGDGHLVDGEECDDGNTLNMDGCDRLGNIEDGWACTAGNTWTSSKCSASGCGDGKRTGTEECDDGNGFDGDGCSSDCKIEQWFDCDSDLGKLSACTCMRVRMDWRDMTQAAKDLYIEAVNDLKASGQYDLFVQTHAHLTNKNYAHGTSGFLPWHRKYLMEYENAIRLQKPKYSCVTIPYWDWAEDTDICSANGGCKRFDDHSSILQDFGGPASQACSTAPHSGTVDCDNLPQAPHPEWVGFDKASNAFDNDIYKNRCKSTTLFDHNDNFNGNCDTIETWGSTGAGQVRCTESKVRFDGCEEMSASQVGCVMDGPFAGWMSPEYPDTQKTTKTCLSRGVNWEIASQGYLTGSQRLQDIITKNDEYGSNGGFRAYIESTPHANPHNLLGGHIRSFSSPADPLFFSHHAFIDKVWSMWQNCHDHDEVGSNPADTPQYKGTQGGWDDGATPMVFTFPPAAGTVSKCTKDDAACAAFVNGKDGWCASNDWDSTCSGFCSQSADCSAGGDRNPREGGVTTWMLEDGPGGDTTTTALPGAYHSIHDMPAGNSYLYAPDQFDLKMSAQNAICNYAESAHHGQIWKGRRMQGSGFKLNEAGEIDETVEVNHHHPIKRHARTLKAMDQHEDAERHLEITVDSCGCPSNLEQGWSSYGVDMDGDSYCDVDPIYDNTTGEYLGNAPVCFCDGGYSWNDMGTKCVSIFPVDTYTVEDPDLKAMLDYYENFATKLMDENAFVKPADSLKAVLDQMVDRECDLLYNSKSNIKRSSTLEDLSSACADESTPTDNVCADGSRPGSLRFQFLKGWGMEESVSLGVADDPCAGKGTHVDTDEDEDRRR